MAIIIFHRQNDIEGIKRVFAVEELANEWKEMLENRINKLISHVQIVVFSIKVKGFI